jgi:hypothetical protein
MRTERPWKDLPICPPAVGFVWCCVEREEAIAREDGYLFIKYFLTVLLTPILHKQRADDVINKIISNSWDYTISFAETHSQ